MTRALIPFIFVAGIAACADQPPTRPAQALDNSPSCLRETGSRLRPRVNGCISAPGQVITHDEIEQTGATSAAEVLHKQVPSAH